MFGNAFSHIINQYWLIKWYHHVSNVQWWQNKMRSIFDMSTHMSTHMYFDMFKIQCEIVWFAMAYVSSKVEKD